MTTALAALLRGLRCAARLPGLLLLLWSMNAGLVALVALPLAARLTAELSGREAAAGMLYGFDYEWWQGWQQRQTGVARHLEPSLLGNGSQLDPLERLLRGELPLGLFAADAGRGLGGAVLGLAAVYSLLHVLLQGGVLAALRGGPGWSARGLLHASGFYAGRLLRLAGLSLASIGLAFVAARPLRALLLEHASRSASDAGATAWLLGFQALLLAALLLIALIASWARVILVLEQRRSALLAWLQALGFCARHPLAVVSLSGGALALGLSLVAAWSLADASWTSVGFRTQSLSLLLAQGLIAGRIGLRVAHGAGQIELYRRLG